MIDSAVARALAKAVGGAQSTSNPIGSMPATVMSTDADGTIWVKLAGAAGVTPARSSTVAVNKGDSVTVTVSGGRATVNGNLTRPATDDAKASEAVSKATDAQFIAESAKMNAETATLAANEAIESAAQATESAGVAKASADEAFAVAQSAVSDAATAKAASETAEADALKAHRAADDAQADANAAHASAIQAAADASSAKDSARRANTAANDALTQLSVVEDVAGTLSWISEHGSYGLTDDAEVVEGRVYFERTGGGTDADPYAYTPIAQPDEGANPGALGWYVLDVADSQADYVMAHLAVTSAGLWVLPSGIGEAATPAAAPGYKMLLASDGAYVYDGSGHLVSSYGESITLDSSRPQYIGGENAYIAYYDSDGDGSPDSIRIGGRNITFESGKTLSDVLEEVENAATTIDIVSTAGTVFKNDAASTVLVAYVHHGGERIETRERLAEVFGAGARVRWSYMRTVDEAWQYIPADDPRVSDGGFRLAIGAADVSGTLALQADVYAP